MWFTHLFVPQAVGVKLKSREVKGAVSELIAALKETGRIQDDALARRDVYAREEEGATWIGQGIAVPHAATQAVDQPVIAHGYSARGIRLAGKQKHQAQHVFLVLGATSSRPLHLRILARLASLLSASEFREGLDRCSNSQEVLALLQAHSTSALRTMQIEEMPRVAVFVSDAQSVGLAAHAALLGCPVNVLGRESEEFGILASMRGINVEGRLKGYAKFEWVGTDTDSGLGEADLLLLSSPARDYPQLAEALAPSLREGQVVLLVPGRLGGALTFSNAVRRVSPGKVVYVCEAQHNLYDAGMESPAKVDINRINARIPVSALPAHSLPDVLGVLNSALPYFVSGGSALETGLRNFSTFFLPALAVLNSPRLAEASGSSSRLRDFLDQPVVRVLESLDLERVAVAEALGIEVSPAVDDLQEYYGAYGDSLLQALLSTRDLEEPLIASGVEDPGLRDCVDFGLSPFTSLAAKMGVSVPTAGALLRLAAVMMGREEEDTGAGVASMGLESMTPDGIRSFLRTGQRPGTADDAG